MGRLPRKISHVRFFHERPSQNNFSREIFLREASVEIYMISTLRHRGSKFSFFEPLCLCIFVLK